MKYYLCMRTGEAQLPSIDMVTCYRAGSKNYFVDIICDKNVDDIGVYFYIIHCSPADITALLLQFDNILIIPADNISSPDDLCKDIKSTPEQQAALEVALFGHKRDRTL